MCYFSPFSYSRFIFRYLCFLFASDHKMQCHKQHTTESKTFKNQPKTNQQYNKNSNSNNDEDDDDKIMYSGVFFQSTLWQFIGPFQFSVNLKITNYLVYIL